jgi:hypothetical protein
MRGVVKLAAGLLVVLVVAGLVVTLTIKVRDAAARTQCQNNLKLIGLGVQNLYSVWNRFPAGTVRNADLPPDKRLSWLTQTLMVSGYKFLFDEAKAWDAAENCPPRWLHPPERTDGYGPDHWPPLEEAPVGELLPYLCPANPARNGPPDLPSPTHYVGIAGLGESAAELPISDPRAGFFGYDRKPTSKDIKDGLSNTLMAAEVLDGGPWSAGGRATVRGLSADGPPYLGPHGQFASLHGGGFLRNGPAVTNALFADASVRPLTDSVSPKLFEALATIAGGEEVGPW